MSTSFYITSLNKTKLLVVETILVLSCLNLIFTNAQTTPIHRSHFCSSEASTFPPNGTYQASLNTLLSSLSAAAALGRNYSFQAAPLPAAPALFGSYLCRGDLDADACGACVATATNEAAERCPLRKEAVLWYDGCMVRYSNRSFSGRLDEAPRAVLVDEFNGTSQASLARASVDGAVAREAARAPARFGTREVKVTPFQTIYSLVQCTPDLSSAQCEKCLNDAMGVIRKCCEGKEGATILFPSCNFRYELFPFYNRTSVTSRDSLQSTNRNKEKGGISTQAIIVIVVCVIVVSLAYFALGYYLSRLKRAKNKKDLIVPRQNGEDADSLQYPLITIETATNEFSVEHRLGRGGFGDVYKGVLPNGQEIAVKRRLKGSGRGEEEFKNEVALIAKLQHRNLVRLLGFCLEGGETILVYEFVPNKSLDYFLFDPRKKELLDWLVRCKIIGGIARGILYLHEDSRLRVIHRDVKASNVLLDKEMNPKISDFGIAKMFGVEDQTDEGRTRTIVGTYGYMAPEYAMEGRYSTKSDVFSFGVLLLEILSGNKSSSFQQTNPDQPYLLAHAWQLWNEEKGLEFMDPVLKNSCRSENEFLRYMHIGLLCVQEDPHMRPTMSFVALTLLKIESAVRLPKPERPPFSFERFGHDKFDHIYHDQYQQSIEGCSTKSLTNFSVTLPR